MSRYARDTRVRVCAFARQEEGDDVTIGDLDRQVFLTIPAEALVILDCLAEGGTVGEAGDRYEDRFGERPDIDDFLEALEPSGFILTGTGSPLDGPRPTTVPTGGGLELRWLSPTWARRLTSPWVVALCAALTILAIGLFASDPATVPGPTVLVFKVHLVAFSTGMTAFGLAGVAVHELAHLVAARAAGARARIGVSRRLWFVVAETDMTGIWMVPKRARYLAFLAGPLVDAASASLLVGVLWARRHGTIVVSPLWTQVLGACLMVYLLRLLWQCYLFVRTDFYFVIATAFDCKNLAADTRDHLHNQASRIWRLWPPVDQCSIPAREMRVIRWYSAVWLGGRGIALCSLILVSLPVMWRYGGAIAPMLIGGRSRYSVVDALVFATLLAGLEGVGIVMWLRGLIRSVTGRTASADL